MTLAPRAGPRGPSEARAWAALTANLLVLPGLGSLLAGRVLEGIAQLAAALVGFAITLVWLWRVVALMSAAGSLLLDPPPPVRLGLEGIALFGGAWLWAAATSWALVRRARDAAPRS